MKKVLIGLGILAVVVIIVVAALGRRKVSGENVYAADVARGDIVTVVTGRGVIQPRTKVNISSTVYGQIVALPVKEGQTIGKGDLLVRIDPEKYQTEVDRLSANLRVNRVAIEQEEANTRNLELNQKRARDLHRQEILSDADVEKADLAVESSRIQLKSLKESVAQAEAALSRAKDDLAKTTIYAPMAGKVTQVNTEVGEQVIIGTTNIPGSVMLVISDMSEVLAEVNVDETEVVRLEPGQKARVTADAVEKTDYDGRVTEIRNTAKKEGDVNVFGVKILLTSPDERLRPGMTAKARIEVEKRQNVVRVPIQAVTTRERKKLEEDRKAAHKRPGEGAGSDRASEIQVASGSAGGSGSAAAPAHDKEVGGGEAARAHDKEAGGGEAAPAHDKEAGSGEAAPVAQSSGSANAPGKGSADGKDGAGTTAQGKGKSEREEIEVVYVVEKGIARAVPVKTGASEESYVEIKEGLKEGETVVTGPYRVLKRLKEGDRVVKKEASEANEEPGEKAGDSDSEDRTGQRRNRLPWRVT